MQKDRTDPKPSLPGPILFVGPYPPVIGGTAAMLRSLIPALEVAGLRCRILNTMVGDRQVGLRDRVGRLLFFHRLGLKTMASGEKIIHCHAVNFANLVGNGIVMACGRLAGKRIVITLHAGDLLAKLGEGRSRRLGRLVLRLAHVVTAVTPELADRCRELGVRHAVFIANDLRYVPHGGDGKELPPEVESFIAGHDPVVTLVGAMNPPYGIDVLLKATDVLRRTLPRAGALIIAFKSGNTGYVESVQALRRDLGLLDHALIPEPFPNVAEALRRSDVFVRPTLSDGDSIAVREALTLGLPVVASDVGFRPAGVAVFPAGDHRKLADKLAEVVQGPRPEPVVSEESEKRTIAAFVAVYDLALGS